MTKLSKNRAMFYLGAQFSICPNTGKSEIPTKIRLSFPSYKNDITLLKSHQVPQVFRTWDLNQPVCFVNHILKIYFIPQLILEIYDFRNPAI